MGEVGLDEAARQKVQQTVIPCDRLGVGKCDPATCAKLAIAALSQIAGPDMAMASFSLELVPVVLPSGVEVVFRARIEKRTPTIAFVGVEAIGGDTVLFTARALFNAPRTRDAG